MSVGFLRGFSPVTGGQAMNRPGNAGGPAFPLGSGLLFLKGIDMSDRMKGVLKYDGKRVDPPTFKVFRKKLDKFVGWCRFCGKRIVGEEAVPDADPYSEEIEHDSTPVVECYLCRDERTMDI